MYAAVRPPALCVFVCVCVCACVSLVGTVERGGAVRAGASWILKANLLVSTWAVVKL